MPPPASGSFDLNAPSAARAYDYFRGGAHNFQADRDLAEQIILVAPWMPALSCLNRSFVHRVVRFYLDEGITQILDLGCGFPTAVSVHGLAQQHVADSRVVYVDYDPIVFTHVESLLSDVPKATILHRDVRDPESVLDHPKTAELIDFAEPVGVLMSGVMNFIDPEFEPTRLVAAYRERLAPGSLLAINHLTTDQAAPQQAREMEQVIAGYKAEGEVLCIRAHEEVRSWFGDFELVQPGVVPLQHWRPDDLSPGVGAPAELLSWCAVGRRTT